MLSSAISRTMSLLRASARSPVLSPSPLPFASPKQSFIRLNLPNSIRSSRLVTMSSSSVPQIIEHVVLLKVKDDTDPTKVSAMVSGLNGLVSLDSVVHLTAGQVHRSRSSVFNFTHMLHSRYKSKDDLGAYTVHPDHQLVVKESVLPICEDVMAVDWIADPVPETLAPPPGSAFKVSFLKLKENVPEDAKNEIFEVIKGLKDRFGGIDQISCGENFSPARAKGFSIASIAVFKDLSELEAADSLQELVSSQKGKVRDYLDGVINIDYVVPSSHSASL